MAPAVLGPAALGWTRLRHGQQGGRKAYTGVQVAGVHARLGSTVQGIAGRGIARLGASLRGKASQGMGSKARAPRTEIWGAISGKD
jgi:hypothetical protein